MFEKLLIAARNKPALKKINRALSRTSRQMRRYVTNIKFHQFEPGLVHVKNAFTTKESQNMVNSIHDLGQEREEGFYIIDDKGNKTLNTTDFRGRMYRVVRKLPSIFTETHQQLLTSVNKIDPTIEVVSPTHAIILHYEYVDKDPFEYIPFHSDTMPVDGEGRYPFISYSFGCSANFLITYGPPNLAQNHPKHNPKNLMHSIQLEHNDAVVFGGPSRYRWHGIYSMKKNNVPNNFPYKYCRYAVTLRHTPELFGREKEFKSRRVEELGKANNLYNLRDMLKHR